MQSNSLFAIVAPFYKVKERTEEAQQDAYAALQKLRRQLGETPDRKVFPEGYRYMGYLLRFFDARDAFLQRDYVQVCWELTDLLEDEPCEGGMRPGVKENLIVLLDEFLTEGSEG